MIFKPFFFLFLFFSYYSTIEEELEKMKKEIDFLNYQYYSIQNDVFAQVNKISNISKDNQKQIDNVTKENTELRQDIRALNQNKKP